MDDKLFAIGDVARRTGLAVRTIRFYADQGIVAPQQSPAGYRLFDLDTVARLDLVRTMRELGLPLATIRQVLHEKRRWPRWPQRTPRPSTNNCTRSACAGPCSEP